jgi:hypothetical protein
MFQVISTIALAIIPVMLYGKYNPVGKHVSVRNNSDEEKRRVERGDEEEEEKRRKTHELVDEGIKGTHGVIYKLNLSISSNYDRRKTYLQHKNAKQTHTEWAPL